MLLLFFRSIPAFINYLVNDRREFQDELAIAVIAKNEAPYLKEWLEYHLLAGVSRFYFYDNESADNTREILAPYIENGTVIYEYVENLKYHDILWSYTPQIEVYNKVFKKYKNKVRYIAFIDIDEFIVPLDKEKITDVIEEVKNTFAKNKIFTGLGVHWVCYGYSGHYKKPEGLVIENYTKSSGARKIIKSIVNPRTIAFFDFPHKPQCFFGISLINGNGRKVSYGNFNITEEDIRKIRINHYVTKSYEESCEKYERNKKGYPGDSLTMPPPFEIKTEQDIKRWERNFGGFPGKDDMVMGRFIAALKERGGFNTQ